MKFIGQYIQSFIARFRNDVYLEDVSTGTIASGGNLGLDSNNKIVKANEAEGDITGITAGIGLSGDDLTGPIPGLNVDASLPHVTTLAGLTSLGAAGATTDIAAGDVTMYNAVNDGNPTVSLGSSATNRFEIKSLYNSGAQTLDQVQFNSYTTSSTNHDGRYVFNVDEVELAKIIDSGLYVTGDIHANDADANLAVTDTTTSSATQGGKIRLRSDDGAAMGDDHRLGVIEFYGAEDASSTVSVGARIQAVCRDAWDGSNNDADLEFYTTNGTTESKVLTLDADKLATVNGSVLIRNDLTVTGDNITFESANADDPNVIIKNTTDDNQAARLTFTKDRGAAMGDNDRIAEIDFIGEDASQNTQGYGKIMCQALESDHGVETGIVKIQAAEYDGTLTNGLIVAGGTADGVVNVTLGAGAASTTTVAGDLAVTTGLILDSVDVTAIQTSGESFADNDTSIMTSAAIDDKINTKYSTSYISFSIKTFATHGTNYILLHGNGISGGLASKDSSVDSAGDFGGVTTEEGGSGTDATCSVVSADLEQQIPIPETCKLIGFYATTSTTTNTGASYDTGVAIWHIPEANVNWGSSTASTATLIHKSDSSRHTEGSNRKKVQKVERMDGTAKTLAAGDIIVPSLFSETADQQIMATITLVIATPIKTI